MIVTPQAIAEARRLGVYGDTAKRLARAARRAAPNRDPVWNKRCFTLFLAIVGNRIEGVARA